VSSDLKLSDFSCSNCDEKKIVRKGRAWYVCENCGVDNSLYVVLMWQAIDKEATNE
jgi:hypothetical protein